MSRHGVLLFDGVCNLCNGIVRFVIERDEPGYFHFAALQSEAGQEILRRFDLPTDALETMVLVEGDRCWVRSDAALRVARRLSGAWRLLALLVVVPRPLRDWAYGYVATHRYAWFGRRESCMVPTPELRARFLA